MFRTKKCTVKGLFKVSALNAVLNGLQMCVNSGSAFPVPVSGDFESFFQPFAFRLKNIPAHPWFTTFQGFMLPLNFQLDIVMKKRGVLELPIGAREGEFLLHNEIIDDS